ncbi:ABC transporter permease [Candidatus Nitrosocosmicus arcticus]|uniref:ABC-type multidrug transport system, permease component n=1 Tax=Candidatus Nitrosocosmicus arcticus TaxID=2035267 RepID=A0A557SWV5_9ARCH|nr:ABC transporter permease [Candidatus Nitrosocosmicus arcticus]TVP41089.1 ABC-type multidrug transport system, permease component [Candidatus Nitrosocosmicus arcticus]
MMITEILILTYRNLIASIDKVFLIWQIIFPIFYIFISGYAYSALLGNQGIKLGEILVSYPSFLAVGMIGFNVMNSSTVAGSIIWNDKRNGMFQQILVMPFTKIQYIISNVVTIMLMGLTSAILILIIGLPTILGSANPTLWSIPYTLYSIIIGAIFFGSFTVIISTLLKSSEGFSVISNGIFLFFAFASSTFYPAEGISEPLKTAFFINPLTYIVDITRAGIYSQISDFVNVEVIIISILAIVAFSFAAVSMFRVKV